MTHCQTMITMTFAQAATSFLGCLIIHQAMLATVARALECSLHQYRIQLQSGSFLLDFRFSRCWQLPRCQGVLNQNPRDHRSSCGKSSPLAAKVRRPRMQFSFVIDSPSHSCIESKSILGYQLVETPLFESGGRSQRFRPKRKRRPCCK